MWRLTVVRQVDEQIRLLPRIRARQTGAADPKLVEPKIRSLASKLIPKGQDLPRPEGETFSAARVDRNVLQMKSAALHPDLSGDVAQASAGLQLAEGDIAFRERKLPRRPRCSPWDPLPAPNRRRLWSR
jgi:hypothetical protein